MEPEYNFRLKGGGVRVARKTTAWRLSQRRVDDVRMTQGVADWARQEEGNSRVVVANEDVKGQTAALWQGHGIRVGHLGRFWGRHGT